MGFPPSVMPDRVLRVCCKLPFSFSSWTKGCTLPCATSGCLDYQHWPSEEGFCNLKDCFVQVYPQLGEPGWGDRGWVRVDEHQVPDLAEGALSILQQSKIQIQLCSDVGTFAFTSRTSRALYPKISHSFHFLSPSPQRIITPGRVHLKLWSRPSSTCCEVASFCQ